MERTIPISNLHSFNILNRVKAMPFIDLLQKIHRVFLVISIEGNLSFIAINNSTYGVKKRSTKNNGHAPIIGHVKDNKISKDQEISNFNRNILTNTNWNGC